MNTDRLQELVSYNLTEELSLERFKEKNVSQREKLLWQWAADRQLTFGRWCQYMAVHCAAED